MSARRGVVTGVDLRVHFTIDGKAACAAEPTIDVTQLVTHDVAVVTCSTCLALPFLAGAA